MHCYLERHIDKIILNQDPVKFDQELDVSLTELDPDFEFDEQGYIDFKRPGYYLLKWSTTSTSGFAQDGPWFELRHYDEEIGGWKPIGNGMDIDALSQEPLQKITSSAWGFIPFEVHEEDLENTFSRYRIALFNISGHSLFLTNFPIVKAAMAVYGIPYFDLIISDLLFMLDQYEEECCGYGLEDLIGDLEIVEAKQDIELTILENFKDCFREQFNKYVVPEEIMPAGTPVIGFPCPDFPGCYITIIRVGYIYTFQMTGTLTSGIASSGFKTILRASDCPALEYYLGDTLMLPLSAVRENGNQSGSFIATLDGNGITTNAGLGNQLNSSGVRYSLCQSVVLFNVNGVRDLCYLE